MGLRVERVPTLADNYTYVIVCEETGEAAVGAKARRDKDRSPTSLFDRAGSLGFLAGKEDAMCTGLAMCFTVLFVLGLSADAYGYIDWGTGSFMIQMLIAGLVGAVFALKLYWKKMTAFFSSRFSKRRRDAEDSSDEDAG